MEDLQEQAGVLGGSVVTLLWARMRPGQDSRLMEELQRVAGEAEELRKKSEPPGLHWMSPALALSLLLLKPCSEGSRLGSLWKEPLLERVHYPHVGFHGNATLRGSLAQRMIWKGTTQGRLLPAHGHSDVLLQIRTLYWTVLIWGP